MRTPLIFPLTYTHEERVAQVRAFNDYLDRCEEPKLLERVMLVLEKWQRDPENDRVYASHMAWEIRGYLFGLNLPREKRQELEEAWLRPSFDH